MGRSSVVTLSVLGLSLVLPAACSTSSGQGSSGDDGGGTAREASVPPAGGGSTSDASSSLADGGGTTRDATIPLADGGSPPSLGGVDAGLGPPGLGEAGQDPPSHGGTITFESIGATGWFPSRRDPATGPCDAYDASACCMAKDNITSDALTPWDEDLIMTLRGPMQIAELAVYQPQPGGSGAGASGAWTLVSAWDGANPSAASGIAFDGNGTEKTGFPGTIGTECLVNVSTSQVFACGSGSVPYCPPPSSGHKAYYGWAGSKLFVILATMPHAPSIPGPCSSTTTGGWYDASWIGLSVGELVRAGSFVSCHCYAKDPNNSAVADGCGQFNVFEVVNDNNSYKNLDVFSTDMIDYAGYVGEGPCGSKCNAATLGPSVDLIDKSTDTEAAQGAVSTPTTGPGAAFRRPESGYRYFLILLDVTSRTVQLAIVHPQNVPASIAALLPGLPASVDGATVDAVRGLRLPK